MLFLGKMYVCFRFACYFPVYPIKGLFDVSDINTQLAFSISSLAFVLNGAIRLSIIQFIYL